MWLSKARWEHLMMRLSSIQTRMDRQDKRQMITLVNLQDIDRRVKEMATREEQARERFAQLLDLVKVAFAAKERENQELRVALANADQTAQARVDAALEADSEFDAAKVEQGNEALSTLLGLMPVVDENTEVPPFPTDPEEVPVPAVPGSGEDQESPSTQE